MNFFNTRYYCDGYSHCQRVVCRKPDFFTIYLQIGIILRCYFGRTEPDTAAPKPVFGPKCDRNHTEQESGRAKPPNSGPPDPNRKQLPIRPGVVAGYRELLLGLR